MLNNPNTLPAPLNGATIKLTRETMGMGHRDLAEELNVNPRNITYWEADQRPMPDGAQDDFREIWDDFIQTVCNIVYRPSEASTIEIDPDTYDNYDRFRRATERTALAISAVLNMEFPIAYEEASS